MDSNKTETLHTFDEAVEKVVSTWADLLTYKPHNKQRRKSLSDRIKSSITEEQFKIFSQSLREGIRDLRHSNPSYIIVSVDYEPTFELGEALFKANIEAAALPIKTVTWIVLKDVEKELFTATGAFGYRSPVKNL